MSRRIVLGVAVGLAGFGAAFVVGRMTADDGGAGAGTTKTPSTLSVTSPAIDVPAPIQELPALAATPPPPAGPQPVTPPSPVPPAVEPPPPPPPPPPPQVTTGIG